MENTRSKIYGVLEDDITDFLKKISYYEKIEAGEIRCINCKKQISISNFGSVLKKNGEYLVSCDDVLCQAQLGRCEG